MVQPYVPRYGEMMFPYAPPNIPYLPNPYMHQTYPNLSMDPAKNEQNFGKSDKWGQRIFIIFGMYTLYTVLLWVSVPFLPNLLINVPFAAKKKIRFFQILTIFGV